MDFVAESAVRITDTALRSVNHVTGSSRPSVGGVGDEWLYCGQESHLLAL